MSPTQGSCDNLGLWKSTNSDGNTNTDKKQKTIFQKAPWKRGAGRFFMITAYQWKWPKPCGVVKAFIWSLTIKSINIIRFKI